MLDGIDDIDWEKVKGNSFGRGPEVVEHLKRLAEPSGEASHLSIMLADDGRIAPSAEMALPFLLELLDYPEANRSDTLEVLESLLCVEEHGWDTVGLDPAEALGGRAVRKKRFRVVYEALEQAIPRILGCLHDAAPDARRGAASLLGRLGRQSTAIVGPVLDHLSTEGDPHVRRGLLLCLGYHRLYLLNPKAKKRDRSMLPRVEAALGRALSDEATRGDAAVALAIGVGPVEPAAFEALRELLLRGHAIDRSLRVRLDPPDLTSDFLAEQLFLCLPAPQTEQVVETLAELHGRTHGWIAEKLARDAVLVAYGALPSDRPFRPAYEPDTAFDVDAPTELQRRSLALAASRAGPFGRTLKERLGYLGLPTDRTELAALAGCEVEPEPTADDLVQDLAKLRDFAGVEVRPGLELNRIRLATLERLADGGADDVDEGDLHSLLATTCAMRMTNKSMDARRDECIPRLLDALSGARRARAASFLRESCGWGS